MGLLQWLWSEPAPEKVAQIERQSPTFEERLEKIVTTSRGLSGRSQAERDSLIEDIGEALQILEGAIHALEAADLVDRAKQIRARLRTTRTRAERVA